MKLPVGAPDIPKLLSNAGMVVLVLPDLCEGEGNPAEGRVLWMIVDKPTMIGPEVELLSVNPVADVG